MENEDIKKDFADFANKIAKDRVILDTLYTPEQAVQIREFANIARTAQRTNPHDNTAMGLLVGSGQAYMARSAFWNAVEGNYGSATKDATAVIAPYFLAKMFNSPTATQLAVKVLGSGKVSREVLAEIAKYAVRAEAIREHKATGPQYAPAE